MYGANISGSEAGFFSELKGDFPPAEKWLLTNELWDYASACYQLPKVQQLCLRMQDEFAVDVTVLLAAGWAAMQGTEAHWPAILPTLVQWQEEIICPLRAIRRKLNKNLAPEHLIRSELLSLEIKTEQTALAYLYHGLTQLDVHQRYDKFSRTSLTDLNLKSYIEWRTGISRDEHQQLALLSEQLGGWLSSYSPPLTDI